jgi:hypothetical protein
MLGFRPGRWRKNDVKTRALLKRYLVYRGLTAGVTLSLPNMIELYSACGLGLYELCLLAASVCLPAAGILLTGRFILGRMRHTDGAVAGLVLLACGQIGYLLSEDFLGLLLTESVNAAGITFLSLADINVVYATFRSKGKEVRGVAGLVFHFTVAALASIPMFAPASLQVYMPLAAAVALVLAALVVNTIQEEERKRDSTDSFLTYFTTMLSHCSETFLCNHALRKKLLFAGAVFTLLRVAQFMILPFLGECRFEPSRVAVYIAVVNVLSALFMGLHPIIAGRIRAGLVYQVLVGTIAGACLLLAAHPSTQGVVFLLPIIWAQVFADIELNNGLNSSQDEATRLSINTLLGLMFRISSAKAFLFLALILRNGAPSGAYQYIGGAALLLGAALVTPRKQSA